MENSKLIRVLQVGMHDKIGGVETYLINYYRKIDKNNVQFDFINSYSKLCFEDEIKEMGGKVYKIPNFKKNPVGYYKQLKKIIKLNNYQIIHINMLSVANVLPILAAHSCKVKHIIVHSHNSNTPSGILRKVLDKLNKKILINYATDFLACSSLAGNWLYNGKKDFKIINNAIDLNKFSPNKNMRNILRKKLNIENKFVIGHVGRFCYQKNHEFLIDVFYEVQKANNDAVLLLIGEGELENKIKDKVKRLGISDKVIFLGTTNQVNNYLNAMDLFVLPSRFEGLPVVGVEAQATKIKTILSDQISSDAKIIPITVQLPITNPKIWADNILKFIKNSKNSVNEINIPKDYDINYQVKNLEKLYINMISLKKKILLYGMTPEVGGIEKYIINFLQNIDMKKFEIDLLAKKEISGNCADEISGFYNDIYIYPCTKFFKHPIKTLLFSKKIAQKNDYDIVYFNIINAGFVLCILPFKLFSNAKIYVHSHNDDDEHNILIHYLSRPLINFIADKKFACSKQAGKWLFNTNKNIIVINNAIDLKKFRPNEKIRNSIRKKLNIENKFIIGHVGRFAYQKNHEFLIDVFYEVQKENENVELLLVGIGELEQEIKEKVHDLHIEDKVIFAGVTDKVEEFFNGMDLFVLPSRFEGLGIVAIEAQAINLKCLLSDSVPFEAKILKSTEFLPLKIEIWKNKILEETHKKHYYKNTQNEIIKSGFEIKNEMKRLEKIFLDNDKV